ncbi:hypothetical protein Poli38472_003939 [Pythium oligandrum]|uniref:MIR domain-containing protein n=1 Tax=Pythium oligandrum TaxID=41045 RepID=A0A8K1CME2_PYTOL|nr:hypothetical protein Poli38472_003939 [Pythium oligandrum]|eukprot:TMW66174.1 hypothetical protein Poli38472_003939 [Pythium oligandrum]
MHRTSMPRVLAVGALLLALSGVQAHGKDAHCVRWRATAQCDPHGVREPHNDAACGQTIVKGLSGYCECENRRRVREVTCDHHEFTCEDACRQDASVELSYPQGFEYVTCGSSIKLVHETSRFRLHSHEIAYGSGSGQQSVTAHSARNDPNSYWLVKEADSASACSLGEKLQCGATIRLEHIQTRRNLHTHQFRAPLTQHHHEVSGFGVAGDGDAGDNWIVECEENQQCSAADKCEDDGLWKRGELVRLRSAATGHYLVTSARARFDDSNCPRCPINGQQQVSATTEKDELTFWSAGEGIYVSA